MEQTDELVERQKLVTNDAETEEEPASQNTTAPQSAPKSAPTPASPVVAHKIKSISSGDTTRSRNSALCSIQRTILDKSQGSAKVTYINERRQKPHPQAGDERFEIKSRSQKFLKDQETDPSAIQESKIFEQLNDEFGGSHKSTDNENTSNSNIKNLKNTHTPRPTPLVKRRANHTSSDKFDDRPIKHHSFVSEVPDVKHMERALLGLLDDFHSGKLKAFGSGCTMDQMTKIREQQESLAKLHFEFAAAEEDSFENGSDLNAAKAQDNMLQLVQRLEQLSISIEQLQSSHTGL